MIPYALNTLLHIVEAAPLFGKVAMARAIAMKKWAFWTIIENDIFFRKAGAFSLAQNCIGSCITIKEYQ
jgi:hypothetical protein